MAETVDQLCNDANEALENNDPERAIPLLDRAIALKPKRVEPFVLLGEALLLTDDLDRAEKVLSDAHGRFPSAPEVLLALAQVHLAQSDDEHDHSPIEKAGSVLSKAEKLAKGDATFVAQIERLRAEAASAVGDLKGAAAALERARDLDPGDDALLLDLAHAWFEILKLDEAKELATRLVKIRDGDPEPLFLLGLIAERRGDYAGAEKQFDKARAIDPETYAPAVRLTKEEFDRVAHEAFERLPERVREALVDVPLLVEDLPSDADLTGPDPLSPLALGMFRGRSVFDGASPAPTSIVLYQRNLERNAGEADDLNADIEDTILHEVGHFVGFDEEDLFERGLE